MARDAIIWEHSEIEVNTHDGISSKALYVSNLIINNFVNHNGLEK